MNDKEDYAGTCYSQDGKTTTKCPAPVGFCPYPQYWDPAMNKCASSSCPSGYHTEWDNTGTAFCMNDQWNYDGTCYKIDGVTKLTCSKPYGYCASGQFWNETSKTCVASKCPSGHHIDWDQNGALYCQNDKWDPNGTCYKQDGVTSIKCPTFNTCPAPSY